MKPHSDKGKNLLKQTKTTQKNELETEGPLSEKDEVKNAEVRTRKATKEHLKR